MSHKSVVCNNHRNTDHTQQLNYFKALIAGEKAISSTEVMHRYQISSTTSIFRSKAVLIKNDYWIIKPVKSRSKTRFMPIGWRLNTSQNNHNVPPVSEPFLYLFSSKNGIFHKFLYRAFWYSRNYTYFYFPKWRYKPRMVLKITNLHILRYLPTCWLYLLECYTIDNQRCTHTASNKWWFRNCHNQL